MTTMHCVYSKTLIQCHRFVFLFVQLTTEQETGVKTYTGIEIT